VNVKAKIVNFPASAWKNMADKDPSLSQIKDESGSYSISEIPGNVLEVTQEDYKAYMVLRRKFLFK
jgi:hypothetical protein